METIISPKNKRSKGKDAWRENLRLAIFAADKIRSTLGPQGSYKLVSYNRGPEQVVKITKDTIAILDELAIQYPPAIIIAESAKMQRDEAGDGVGRPARGGDWQRGGGAALRRGDSGGGD